MISSINPPVTKRRPRRRRARIAGDREAQAIAATLGHELYAWRKHAGISQAVAGERLGISAARVADLEQGRGARAPLALWVGVGIVIDRPLATGFSRPAAPTQTRDGGHLPMQELVLRLARAHGRVGTFELRTRWLRSVDVGLRDDHQRVLILGEIWNRVDDVGGAARDTNRKRDEVAQLAALREPAYRVASCWIVRATAANRALIAAYPHVFSAMFPGSSRAWVRALEHGDEPPAEPGLVWADLGGTRLFEWRRVR